MPNDRARQQLRISPTPFKSSFLSIPPSPFSPRTPLTRPSLPTKPQLHNKPHGICPAPVSALPSRPLAWVWKCHQCHRSYHLGITRRCLDDGHYFCAGTTTVQKWRKTGGAPRTKRHRACASEFDYQGWKDWGRWRRGGLQKSAGQSFSRKDCWNNCDYPSECRWGKQFGVHTPVDTVSPRIEAEGLPVLSTPIEGVLKTRTDRDGDVLMTTIDPALLTKPSTTPPPMISDASTASTAVAAASAAVDSLKALISRKKTKRGRTMRFNKACGDRTYMAPLLTVSRPVVLRPGEQVRASDHEALLEGFAPLERVASRDSGYSSFVDTR